VTAQQWQALARVIGRPDQAADEELGTMVGRFRRAEEVNGAIHAYTRAHRADEVVAACVEARVPAAIVGNGAELPRNEQLAARNVFVRQPGESRHGAPPGSHRVSMVRPIRPCFTEQRLSTFADRKATAGPEAARADRRVMRRSTLSWTWWRVVHWISQRSGPLPC